MTRIIFFCMAIAALSFVVAPIYNGISDEHTALTQVSSAPMPDENTLSFEEIYEMAEQNNVIDPASLNEITPAAGENTEDQFSSAFSGQEDSALEDQPQEKIEAETSF